ncbi:MAG: MarR family winged helix-turn-helix transcriptional regulator [Arenicella sp.]
MDHVDTVIEQWNKERGDLNVAAMATIGRVMRLSIIFGREMEKTFNRFNLHMASFDVLATLRRSGTPYALSPGDLIASTMVTSGTMTNRIDQLEKAELITRTKSETDKRSVLIALTDAGFELIDKVIEEHVKTQQQLTANLSDQERGGLDAILRKMTHHFENP